MLRQDSRHVRFYSDFIIKLSFTLIFLILLIDLVGISYVDGFLKPFLKRRWKIKLKIKNFVSFDKFLTINWMYYSQ